MRYAPAQHHSGNCLPQDRQIHPKGVIVDIVDIKLELFIPGQGIAPADLGQAGGGVEKSEAGKPSHSGTRESATASVKCTGSCSSSSGSTSLTFKGTRQLSEGVAVTIRDGKAKFSFHQLVVT